MSEIEIARKIIQISGINSKLYRHLIGLIKRYLFIMNKN